MRRLIPLMLTAALLVACGDDDDSPSEATAASGYPLTIENCGIEHTYKGPPKRAVTLNQNVTEIMLALGLQDRMAGTAFVALPVADRYRKAYESVPSLAKRYPAREELIAADPDFVYGGLDGAFGDDPLAGRRQLEDLGIPTFQATENCANNPGAKPRDLTMAVLYGDIRTLGRIFDAQDRAARLIADLRESVQAVATATKGVRKRVRVARLRTPESGTALTDGRASVGNLVISLAGGRNVFDDRPERNAEISWEEVARRNPQVIFLASAVDDNSEAIEFLDGFPAVADVEAVRRRRYATIGFAEVALGVRTVDGIRRLATYLYPDLMRGD